MLFRRSLTSSTRRFLTFLAMGVAVNASAVNRYNNISDDDYIARANRAQFSMVGRLSIRTSTEMGIGTATFIGFGNGKAWILTAAHVLEGYIPAQSSFIVGERSYTLGPGGFERTGDVAVTPIMGVREGDMTAARFGNTTISIPADLSMRTIGTFIGFGRSGTGSHPDTEPSGTKRAFTNVIDALNPRTFNDDGSVLQQFTGYACDFDNGAASGNTLDSVDNRADLLPATQRSNRAITELEGSTGSGDSGGPLFIQSGQNWVIAGVISQRADNAQGNGGYGCWDLSQPVDQTVAGFITRITGIQPLTTPAPAPAPTNACAEPKRQGSWGVLLLGATAALSLAALRLNRAA